MEGEERGDERSAPDCAGHSPQQAEEQERVGDVKEEIGEVMAGGIETIELAIQEVREPGERMPVARVAGGEGPENVFAGQPGVDLGIIRDVLGVIVVVEFETGDWPIQGEGDQGEKHADASIAAETGGLGGGIGNDRHLHDGNGGIVAESFLVGEKISEVEGQVSRKFIGKLLHRAEFCVKLAVNKNSADCAKGLDSLVEVEV
jgi:hypothetical protein